MDLIEDIKNKKDEGDYIVQWYTKETFVYKMVNNTIRRRNLLEMFQMRLLIYLLNY